MRRLGNKVDGAQSRGRGRRAGDAGDARRCRTTSHECARLARGDRLPGDAEGELGRRRPRHARGARTTAQLARAAAAGAARGEGRVRQGRGLSRKAGAPRAARRSADPRRCARQSGASVRARLLRAAPQPEGRGTRAGGISQRRAARRAVRGRARHRPRGALPRRRHRRVPAGCRQRQASISSRSIRASRSSTRSPSA